MWGVGAPPPGAPRYSIGHVLYKLGASHAPGPVRRAGLRLNRSWLGSTGVPLNLFDIVTVVARRPLENRAEKSSDSLEPLGKSQGDLVALAIGFKRLA